MRNAGYVVHVAVGVDDPGEAEVLLRDRREDALGLVAGIEQNGLAGFLIAQQIAIFLKRSDRQTFKVQRGGSPPFGMNILPSGRGLVR